MLNIKDINRYFIRTTKLPECPELVGQIIYLRHVEHNGIVVSMTNDCRPKSKMIPLSAQSNDDGWYDVTELVLDANCSITPRYDICTFATGIATVYRDHLDDPKALKPCNGHDATGRLCFIGRVQDGRLVFSKTAYYVVSSDRNGFYITYSGFCLPKDEGKPHPDLLQRIVRLEGTGQNFYEAEAIVAACNKMYVEDVNRKDAYIRDLQDKVATTSTATTTSKEHRSTPVHGNVSGLNLN